MRIFLLFFFLFASFSSVAMAEVVKVGKGGYRTDLPPGSNNEPRPRVKVEPLVADSVDKAAPTSDWWSSLIWPVHSPHSLPMFPHPLAVQAHSSGLGIGYTPKPIISHAAKNGEVYLRGTEYKYPYRESLVVGLKDFETKATVAKRFSDWSVTALWKNKTDELLATIAHGSPFVFFERQSEKPIQIQFRTAKMNRQNEPVDPLVFEWRNITARNNRKIGEIQLAVNAGTNVGVGSKARLVYDFNGDGQTDRVETFSLFATDPVADSFENYTSKKQPLDRKLTFGPQNEFKNGTVRLEFWKVFGKGDLSLNLAESNVLLPVGDKPVFLTQKGGFARKPEKGIAKLKATDEEPGAATVFHQQGGVLGVSLNGVHFGIFAPTGSTWQGVQKGRADVVTSDLSGKDYLSVAVLPDNKNETLNWFRQRAYAFIADTRIEYAYEPDRASVRTNFKVTTVAKEGTNRQTALALYRHQFIHADQKDRFEAFEYASPRGKMKVLSGAGFSTTIPFLGVLPALPTFEKAKIAALLEADARNILQRKQPFERDDSYWNGKEFGKVCELIQIADQLKKTKTRNDLLKLLKARLEDWFDGDEKFFFCYDQKWGALIGYPESYGSAEQFNDHHFHYSYFIKAAATIARFDPDWAKAENYGGMVDLLIRNCANYDRTDKRFPWMRNFDPYAGHSWASGHAGFASGNNQESSSESMNFASALVLYGQATGDDKIRDLGIYWHSTEAEAIRQYWFDVDGEVFPPGYRQTCVGMVWGDGGTYGTWWTANPEEIHGINYLPINGGSLYLGRNAAYVAANIANMATSNRSHHNAGNPGDPESFDRWRDIIAEYQALADADNALAAMQANTDDPEFGETRTHTMQWIHSLKQLGKFDASIRSNHPTAVVFRKGDELRYVIYNASNKAIDVSFSNGRKFNGASGLKVYVQ